MEGVSVGKKGNRKRTPKEVLWARRGIRLGFGAAGAAVASMPMIDAAMKANGPGGFNVRTFGDTLRANYGVPVGGAVDLGTLFTNGVVLPLVGGLIAKVGSRVAKIIN